MTARTRIQARSNPTSHPTIGKAMTESAEAISDRTLIGLRPYLSIAAPTSGITTSAGIVDSAARRPAAAGDPVNSSTNHGKTTITTPLPMPEVTLAVSSKTTGARRLSTLDSVTSHDQIRWAHCQPTSSRDLRTQLVRARRGFHLGVVRQDEGVVHRLVHSGSSTLVEGLGHWLGDRRIRHAAAGHHYA